jgi:RNA polymerase nonessential primary-like sigma factor
VGDNQDTELLDILPDESISSDERLTKELLRLDLNNLLASLPHILHLINTISINQEKENKSNI